MARHPHQYLLQDYSNPVLRNCMVIVWKRALLCQSLAESKHLTQDGTKNKSCKAQRELPESSLIPLTLSASRWWFFQKSQSQSGTTGRCSRERRCTCRRSAAESDPLLWPCSPWLCRTRLCRTQTAGSNHADGRTLEEERHGVSNSQETLRKRVHRLAVRVVSVAKTK